jgi:signal recognition particle subunit SRP54
MFENLQDRLGSILNNLTGRGALSEKDVSEAMREVRRALHRGRRGAGSGPRFHRPGAREGGRRRDRQVVKPGQMVVKIVHDELVAMLGEEGVAIDLNAPRPRRHHDGRPAGLGQDHHHRQDRRAAGRSATSKKVLMASLDTRRPAAQEQLASSASRSASPRCRSSRASRRPTCRAPVQAASSAAMTWSFSTPPAAPISTSR